MQENSETLNEKLVECRIKCKTTKRQKTIYKAIEIAPALFSGWVAAIRFVTFTSPEIQPDAAITWQSTLPVFEKLQG